MTRNRITRRSLKRKIIGVASALFMAVALIASGFSAWIVSSNAKAEANIGVSVTTVSKSVMTISVDGLGQNGKLDQALSFRPDEDDRAGRVRYSDSVDGGGCESLTILLTGSVTNAQHLGALSVTLDYSDTLLEEAEQLGYITLPSVGEDILYLTDLNAGKQEGDEFVTLATLEDYSFGYIIVADQDDLGNPVYDDAGEQTFTAYFVYEITFGWGEKFAYVNPGYYYDGIDKQGNKLSNYNDIMAMTADDIVAELNAFNNTLKDSFGSVGNLSFTIDAGIK